VQDEDYNYERESLLGMKSTNPYWEDTARYYLTGLLFGGDLAGYEAERNALAKRLTGEGQGDMAERIIAETDRIARIMRQGQRYGGELVSGDTLSWALAQENLSLEEQLTLLDYLNTGIIPDSYLTVVRGIEPVDVPVDGYLELLRQAVRGRMAESEEALSLLTYRLAYAQAWKSRAREKRKPWLTGRNTGGRT